MRNPSRGPRRARSPPPPRERASAMKLAITPPEVSNPKLSSRSPTRSHHSQRITSSSTKAAGGPRVPHVHALLGDLRQQLPPTVDIHNGGGVK